MRYMLLAQYLVLFAKDLSKAFTLLRTALIHTLGIIGLPYVRTTRYLVKQSVNTQTDENFPKKMQERNIVRSGTKAYTVHIQL